MTLDFVESRVANPVRLVDGGQIDESFVVVCPCCGWKGHLGECERAVVIDARVYACRECSMTLVVRMFPRLIPIRFIASFRTPVAPAKGFAGGTVLELRRRRSVNGYRRNE